ncbi:hypothetical protein WJX81_000876 [Elliptochloris bilobata]|uniref:Uncharacterized protein n=1 Tax=Elliptochloris bilobata TaxID=381761 RepID=A0AAW1SE88_9CHLO
MERTTEVPGATLAALPSARTSEQAPSAAPANLAAPSKLPAPSVAPNADVPVMLEEDQAARRAPVWATQGGGPVLPGTRMTKAGVPARKPGPKPKAARLALESTLGGPPTLGSTPVAPSPLESTPAEGAAAAAAVGAAAGAGAAGGRGGRSGGRGRGRTQGGRAARGGRSGRGRGRWGPAALRRGTSEEDDAEQAAEEAEEEEEDEAPAPSSAEQLAALGRGRGRWGAARTRGRGRLGAADRTRSGLAELAEAAAGARSLFNSPPGRIGAGFGAHGAASGAPSAGAFDPDEGPQGGPDGDGKQPGPLFPAWRNLLQAYAAGVPPTDPEALWDVGGAYHAALLEAEMRAALRGNVAAIAAANAAHAVLIAALQ